MAPRGSQLNRIKNVYDESDLDPWLHEGANVAQDRAHAVILI